MCTFWAGGRWAGLRGNRQMENTVRIRRATEADLSALVRLNSIVQELHARNEPAAFKFPSDDSASKKLFQTLLNEPEHCVLVVEQGQAVVGYLFAREVKKDGDWLSPAQRHFMLENIGVDPAFRRQGFGRALIGAFFAEAKARGILRTEVVHWSFNENASRFFRKQGFAPMYVRMGKPLL
jgi:ribosomal protein S18 acetylase RimI-like enzyme